ncbi:MAG: 6-phosphogluconolactonase, partial [Ilumatobacteraceae bacterium]
MDIHVAENAADASVVAAEWLARQLRNAVRRRGTASLAVSGGGTAPPMFTALAQLDVPWADITVWQVDERVAPDGDPARNAGQLDALPLSARQVKLMPVTAKA